MYDMISRDAVLERMKSMAGCATCDNYNYVRCRACIWNDVMNIVDEMSAEDAVTVVRCRNCKYGEPETNGFSEDMVMCQNKLNPIGDGDWLMPPEFFCADGERRDGA